MSEKRYSSMDESSLRNLVSSAQKCAFLILTEIDFGFSITLVFDKNVRALSSVHICMIKSLCKQNMRAQAHVSVCKMVKN